MAPPLGDPGIHLPQLTACLLAVGLAVGLVGLPSFDQKAPAPGKVMGNQEWLLVAESASEETPAEELLGAPVRSRTLLTSLRGKGIPAERFREFASELRCKAVSLWASQRMAALGPEEGLDLPPEVRAQMGEAAPDTPITPALSMALALLDEMNEHPTFRKR